jgi:hypothetical protein
MIEKLGIAAEIKPKRKFPPPAGFVGKLLVSGEVDIAFRSKPELARTEGVDAKSVNSEAGKALLKFPTTSEARAVFKAKGFDL